TQTRITVPAYLQRLHEHPAAMYAAAGSGQAQRTISRVWDITIEAIRARDAAAIKLLDILACYAPGGIPRIILGEGDETEWIAVDEALAVLASYRMVNLTSEAVSMHRLVQAVILAQQPQEDEGPLTTALEWLNAALPADPEREVAKWPLLRVLIPHA